ncbi:Txe/YoeB family addiction module toxin [Brumimicrobium aurantiacum]|uniref:Putative mRNA interferase YoeB n=1 Tax=Brumimicrobium aurantiacum TaxID=1737063 RepID=A0A3E1EZR5_9FLAO|nr:Txe/YoeB family addiction module toxin [Brumimicrobium aurantiacum]RFC54973.1 Txe/YoeB family addiction module toxin [Brumimicrobium aurantiacum]
MSYQLDISDTATKDIKYYRKSGDKVLLKKLNHLLLEIIEHPYTGTGKPEQLKHELSGYWSRRINKEHRIVYQVIKEDNKVIVLSLKGHYW